MIVPETPVQPGAIERRRTADPIRDVASAWCGAGLNPRWHRMAQEAVRRCMPVLADALDRMTAGQVMSRGEK